MPKIVCVVPSIRPEMMDSFRKAWRPLFEKHQVTLITVWDGEVPQVEIDGKKRDGFGMGLGMEHISLFCRHTDACRNLGFVAAASMNPDFVLTLDDDVTPFVQECPVPDSRTMVSMMNLDLVSNDPIQDHIDALSRRVPISWMNTAHDTDLYLRGVPYSVRDESPVMLSHGVWVGTPDFDGETQLRLEESGRVDRSYGGEIITTTKLTGGVPYALPYYVGPIPKGTLFPLCGMNVMIRREALPYFYFAPMGPDTGIVRSDLVVKQGIEKRKGDMVYEHETEEKQVPLLNRFADIFMGIFLKKQFDALGWACVTGYSTVLHTRASDAKKNFEQEKLGRGWNEQIWQKEDQRHWLFSADPFWEYMWSYKGKRDRYAKLIRGIMGESK